MNLVPAGRRFGPESMLGCLGGGRRLADLSPEDGDDDDGDAGIEMAGK